MAEHDADREESYQEEPEEKKFPVFIVPLIAGPVLLLVLIVALAGGSGETTSSSPVEVFDYDKLRKEADEHYVKASELYFQAMHVENQKEKDKILNEAYDICAKAMDNFGRIDRYYEENKLRPRAGHKFEWEDGYQQASQLQYDIQKAMGM
jgi:hypothetical protein